MRIFLCLMMLTVAATNVSGQGGDNAMRTARTVFVPPPVPKFLAAEGQHEELTSTVLAARQEGRSYPRWLFPAIGSGLGVTGATYHALTTDADYYSEFSWAYESLVFGGVGALTGWIIDWFVQETKKP